MSRRFSSTGRVVLLLASLSLLSTPARAEVITFSALPLSGTQEVPAADSKGYGWLTATYDTATRLFTFGFRWQLDGGAMASAAHFHGPAAIGESAGVAIGISGLSMSSSGSHGSSVTLSEGQGSELLAGRWYLNIHSNNFGGGELRAQLIPDSGGPVAARFDSGSGQLSLPGVLVPGSGIYDASLRYAPEGSTLRFELQSANAVR